MKKTIDLLQDVEHIFAPFDARAGRYDFLLENFSDVFENSSSILDVGCSGNFLKERFSDKVTGIDIAGNPDYKVDLEKESLQKFSDNSFELVICTEVLEHIDNLHEVFDDLIRVSSRYILISLPNCASGLRLWHNIRTAKSGKFYGLPFEKPEDRHKWFFTHKEVIRFFTKKADQRNLKVARLVLRYALGKTPKEASLFSKLKHELVFQIVKLFKWKRFSQDVFVVFEK